MHNIERRKETLTDGTACGCTLKRIFFQEVIHDNPQFLKSQGIKMASLWSVGPASGFQKLLSNYGIFIFKDLLCLL